MKHVSLVAAPGLMTPYYILRVVGRRSTLTKTFSSSFPMRSIMSNNAVNRGCLKKGLGGITIYNDLSHKDDPLFIEVARQKDNLQNLSEEMTLTATDLRRSASVGFVTANYVAFLAWLCRVQMRAWRLPPSGRDRLVPMVLIVFSFMVTIYSPILAWRLEEKAFLVGALATNSRTWILLFRLSFFEMITTQLVLKFMVLRVLPPLVTLVAFTPPAFVEELRPLHESPWLLGLSCSVGAVYTLTITFHSQLLHFLARRCSSKANGHDIARLRTRRVNLRRYFSVYATELEGPYNKSVSTFTGYQIGYLKKDAEHTLSILDACLPAEQGPAPQHYARLPGLLLLLPTGGTATGQIMPFLDNKMVVAEKSIWSLLVLLLIGVSGWDPLQPPSMTLRLFSFSVAGAIYQILLLSVPKAFDKDILEKTFPFWTLLISLILVTNTISDLPGEGIMKVAKLCGAEETRERVNNVVLSATQSRSAEGA